MDIAPHMKPDDVPENLWLQVSDLCTQRIPVNREFRASSDSRCSFSLGPVVVCRRRGAATVRTQLAACPPTLIHDGQVDDLNRPFTFRSNHFDLVHSRLVAGGINRNRWPSYLRDIKRFVVSQGICSADSKSADPVGKYEADSHRRLIEF